VNSLVGQLDGKISVKSGNGTEFTIEFIVES
jgi:two-component sensor histidine kinase